MKIQLPLENWADVLPFVRRHQLVELVKQLGDRQFAKNLQFFLTQVGQITLGHLRIVAPRENDDGGPIVEVRKPFLSECEWASDLETKVPGGPMPNNVKDFKLIELSYFDPSVANFLRQFQQEQQGNSLLDNVNLWVSSSLSPRDTTFMPILAQMMPMINNINSISMWHLHHTEFGRVGFGPKPRNAMSQLLTTMLTDARILEIRTDMAMSMFSWRTWLYAPRDDDKPRALRLPFSFPDDTKNLIEQIKKDFSKASHPASFFVYVRALVGQKSRRNVHWQDGCLDNGQTNERIVVKTMEPPAPPRPGRGRFRQYPERHVLISRYPLGANQQWIEANEQEILEGQFHEQNRRIHFEQSLGGTEW